MKPTGSRDTARRRPASPGGDPRNGARAGWGPALLALLVFAVFSGHCIRPSLHLHEQGEVFFLDAGFWARTCEQPGAAIESLGAALIQLGRPDALGAIVLGAIALGLLALNRIILARWWGRPAFVLSAVPLAWWMGWLSDFSRPPFTPVLGLLLTLGCLALAQRVQEWSWFHRLWAEGAGLAVLFWLAGAWVWWLALLIASSELRIDRRRWPLAAGVLAAAFLATTGYARMHPYPDLLSLGPASLVQGWPWLPGLLVFYLSCLTAAAVRAWLPAAWIERPRPWYRRIFMPHGGRGQAAQWLEMGLALAMGMGLWRIGHDRGRQARLELDRAAREHRWDQVLERMAAVGLSDTGARLDACQALFHTGRLGDLQFHLPHHRKIPFLPEFEQVRGEWILPLADTLLALGEVNYALRWLHEGHEISGDQPRILQRLAAACRIKGNENAARIYLGRLSQHPRYRGWARSQLAFGSEAAAASQGPDTQLPSRAVPTTDFPGSYLDTEQILGHLLHDHPDNRMAFEYQMAHWLASGRLEDAVRQLDRLKSLGYSRIPIHYEEALLIHHRLQRTPPRPPEGMDIRPETRQRFTRFDQLFERYQNDIDACRRALAPGFGATYWYYHLFGTTAGLAASEKRS